MAVVRVGGLCVAVVLMTWTAALTVFAGHAHAIALPDGRGYELVSPAQKNGADVMVDSARTRARADGNAVAFTSLGGFDDVHGSGVAFDYLAERSGLAGTSGWVTHGTSPRQDAEVLGGTAAGFDSLYVGEFAADLSCGVYYAQRPLAGIGSPADIPSLYRRDDLLTPGLGSYTLVTQPSVPVPPPTFDFPGLSRVAGMSADCRHIAFETPMNLVPEASGSALKLYESADGVLRLAGVLPDGSAAASSIAGLSATSKFTPGTVSPDGSRVFFASPADGNVYVRVNGATTVQMDAAEKDPRDSPAPSSLWLVSADGARAFFITSEQLVIDDRDSSADLYRFDVDAPAGSQLTLITPSGGPEIASADSVVGTSVNGDVVYFFSAGQLVRGEPALGSQIGLYVWQDGAVRFIAPMEGATDVIPNGLNTGVSFEPLTSRVSVDGRRLLFMSTSGERLRGRGGFAGYPQGDCNGGTGCRELYVYDSAVGALTCASCNPSGAPPTVNVAMRARTSTGAASTTSHLSHALSNDGLRVFFTTAEALVAEDVNGRSDVYEYDVPTATVSIISSGRGHANSYFMDASADGHDVFFLTQEQLVGWDTDANYDLYDARVGGGMPEPVRPAAPCSDGTCQAPPVAAPALPTVSSFAFLGAGNERTRLKHRRKARLHRGKCPRRGVRSGRCHRARRGVRTSARDGRKGS